MNVHLSRDPSTSGRPLGPDRRVRGAGLLGLGVAAALLLGGCGGDGPATPVPGGPSPTAAAGSSSPGAPTSESTSTDTSSVSPATGDQLRTGDTTMNLLANWSADPGGDVGGSSSSVPKDAGSAYLSTLSVPDSFGTSTAALTKSMLGAYRAEKNLKAADPVEIDGMTAARVTAGPQAGTGYSIDFYSVVIDGSWITVEIDLDRRLSDARRQELTDSMLATVSWG